jgi:hypothetical protein
MTWKKSDKWESLLKMRFLQNAIQIFQTTQKTLKNNVTFCCSYQQTQSVCNGDFLNP